ncbi:MAG: hypothetical protein VX505_01270 [Chloroflexota bacterium]|nr:hypothetical protein [Chloroflexota bacterium]
MDQVDGNHLTVVLQHVMAKQMVFGEISAPLEHVSTHGVGRLR